MPNRLIKLMVITVIVFLGISCAIGDSDGNKGKDDGNKKNNDDKMGSRGDWLNPNIVSSGYYFNFPWYTSGGSFYSQEYSEITFSPFREYYTTSITPLMGDIISTPSRFDIAQKMPSEIYYGTGQALPYSQYVSTVPSRNNELWVQGATNWTQYVVSPVGTGLQLVAYAPVEGPAGFYEIVQTDKNTLKYKTYQFYSGYNTMNFAADQVGRHMLYFVVNNQPSNVVIVDVFAQAPAGNTGVTIYPAAKQMPVTVLGNAANPESVTTSGSSSQIPNGLTTTTTSNGQTTTTTNGQTTITPVGQTTTTSDGTYQTTTSSDGTQTTTSSSSR